MKILLDEMYTGMKEYLEALGWEIETVNTIGMQGVEDSKLADCAKEKNLIIVTEDEKLADIAELKNVPCVFVSNKLLAKMIDSELKTKIQ